MSGGALAGAAEKFIGATFRLNGRDPVTGLDCLGLVILSLAEIGRPVRLPLRYGMRNAGLARYLRLPEAHGFVAIDGTEAEPGDVLVFEPGPGQLHLAIVATQGGIIHAHAGLRRVVRTPFPLPSPIIGHWRLT